MALRREAMSRRSIAVAPSVAAAVIGRGTAIPVVDRNDSCEPALAGYLTTASLAGSEA